MEVNGQPNAFAALSPGKELQYQLNRRLAGPLNWSGHFGEEKISFPCEIIQPLA
jgi:hypothetical protein